MALAQQSDYYLKHKDLNMNDIIGAWVDFFPDSLKKKETEGGKKND
jgi:hypothetical protein